jgi:Domain of unknown function (DUF4873)
VADEHGGDGYAGAAEVRVGDVVVEVTVALSGRFEPVDGAYHWSGRTGADPVLAAAVRAGQRGGVVRLPGHGPVKARLAEVDPWGGVRLVGAGTPPWRAGPGLTPPSSR